MKQFVALREANEMRDCEWDPECKLDALFKATELGGECGEVLNKIKKLERERLGLRGSRTTKEELGEELADVVICVDIIAMHYGISLWNQIVNTFNQTSEKNGFRTRIDPSV